MTARDSGGTCGAFPPPRSRGVLREPGHRRRPEDFPAWAVEAPGGYRADTQQTGCNRRGPSAPETGPRLAPQRGEPRAPPSPPDVQGVSVPASGVDANNTEHSPVIAPAWACRCCAAQAALQNLPAAGPNSRLERLIWNKHDQRQSRMISHMVPVRRIRCCSAPFQYSIRTPRLTKSAELTGG